MGDYALHELEVIYNNSNKEERELPFKKSTYC